MNPGAVQINDILNNMLPPRQTVVVTLTRVVLAPPVHLVTQVQEPEPPMVVRARYQAAPGVTVTVEAGSYWLATWEYNVDTTLDVFWQTGFEQG